MFHSLKLTSTHVMTVPSRRPPRGWLALPLLLCGAAAAPAGDLEKLRPECGFYCLAVGLRTFEIDGAGAKELRARLGDPGREGYSLAELRKAADDLGVETLPVATTLDNLKARSDAGDRFAAVAHVDGNHFVLISGFEPDGRVKLIDPPGSYAQPPETFDARWDGTALLLSPDPLTPEADLGGFPWLAALLAAGGAACALAVGGLWYRGRRGAGATTLLAGGLGLTGCGGPTGTPAETPAAPPRIVMTNVLHDAGEVPVGAESRVVVFPFTNAGGSPLTVTGISTSCQCTDAIVTAMVLQPGGTAELRAAFTPDAPAKKHATVVLTTDDPDAPAVRAEVRWHAVAALTPDPPELNFGVLRPGAVVERTVRLVRRDLPGGGATAGAVTASPDDRLTAVWEGPADAAADAPRTARVRFVAPEEPGAGSGAVTVLLKDAWADSLRVPVRREVRDLVAVKPATVAFRAGPPGAPGRARVLVSADGPVSLSEPPTFVGGEGWGGIKVTVTLLTADRLLIDLLGPLPDAGGRHAGTLTFAVAVETGDGPPEVREVRREVSAFVLGGPAVAALGGGE